MNDPAVNTITPGLWRIQFNGATKKNHGTTEVGYDLCHSIGAFLAFVLLGQVVVCVIQFVLFYRHSWGGLLAFPIMQ